ncbi:unnamed protein product [Eruca vesicaria subsp. sativa]|uniref:Replication factor A C-terminal domain-containing protein n=1 Tax=Eruca vesicaria subsp. sativa TaxID=29727 RepID=A0ABC8J211_ERUVS|nr:unnamed protein product [Eruca vesicaria subsp. sativa]
MANQTAVTTAQAPSPRLFSTVAQGFIPKNRLNRYENDLEHGCIYTLTKFFASNNKVMYCVDDQKLYFTTLSHHLINSYSSRLAANPAAASSVNKVEIVKVETLKMRVNATFIKREPQNTYATLIAYFDCIATTDDVKLGTEWYFIACKDCQTKLNQGPTTFICPKYRNENATAIANFRVELSVYDNEEQSMFIIIGDAGKELKSRRETELIDKYADENGGDGAEHEVPLPQCFIDTIVQTHKFRIKVVHFNFTSKMTLTVTKLVSPAVLPPKDQPADMSALPPASEVDISLSSVIY